MNPKEPEEIQCKFQKLLSPDWANSVPESFLILQCQASSQLFTHIYNEFNISQVHTWCNEIALTNHGRT